MSSSTPMLKTPISGQVPAHVAIVMDGNGRWAQKRGLARSAGHIQGASILEEIVEAAIDFGIKRLTLYCFSHENWKRPKEELDALMSLLKSYMKEQRPVFMKNKIRLRIIGRRNELPSDVLQEMDETVRLTSANDGLTLALAINYGARQEITDAVKKIVRELSSAIQNDSSDQTRFEALVQAIDEKYISSRLYDPEAPDPDLFIRTGGEQRLSNYLLWQLSYAELWFTDVLWPDFTPETLKDGILAYQKRQRRYGGLNSSDLKTPYDSE
ncbi:MAG: polyprenyl diphosphate synthase [Thermoguttaceae bacterium]